MRVSRALTTYYEDILMTEARLEEWLRLIPVANLINPLQ